MAAPPREGARPAILSSYRPILSDVRCTGRQVRGGRRVEGGGARRGEM